MVTISIPAARPLLGRLLCRHRESRKSISARPPGADGSGRRNGCHAPRDWTVADASVRLTTSKPIPRQTLAVDHLRPIRLLILFAEVDVVPVWVCDIERLAAVHDLASAWQAQFRHDTIIESLR